MCQAVKRRMLRGEVGVAHPADVGRVAADRPSGDSRLDPMCGVQRPSAAHRSAQSVTSWRKHTMVTTATTAANLTEEAIQQFAGSIRGGVVRPGDPNYDEARKVYNAMIDKRPALIARCTDAGDVITAVNFARE